MKLKILLAPSLLALIIILIIWLVMPRYFEDRLKREEFKNETARLNAINEKIEKVNNLMVNLGTNTENQNILFSFLPEKQQEEEIINDLNNIASTEAVSIKNLSLIKSPSTSLIISSEGAEAEESEAAIKNFDVDFTVIGTYDKIKNIINKLYKSRRFNKVASLEITKNETEAAGNNLQVKFILTFSYLKKANVISIGSNIFSQDSFNMSVISKINNWKTINVAKIGNISGGRENPFLP